MRLELSRRTDLAVRALRTLAAREGRMKRPDLAAEADTTPDFLARVMAPLVRSGWVRSEVGRGGGYELATDPAGISMLDVVVAVEGHPDDGRCVLRGGPCGTTAVCSLHDAWDRARGALLDELGRTPVMGNGGERETDERT